MTRQSAPKHRPRKRFGQHFLADPWARKVVSAIAPQPKDIFLEIGAGAGALTRPLAESGAPILAVEIDRDLAEGLAARAPANVTVVTGDILATDLSAYLTGLQHQQPPDAASPAEPRHRVVGNLPYYIASPILFRILELQRRTRLFHDAIVMVQREVADRIVADPGTRDYGVLTIMLSREAVVSRLFDLPPGAFTPAPKVRSAVVRLGFDRPPLRVRDDMLFETLVKGVFGQRRKTLANSLRGVDPLGAEALRDAGLDGRRRPETLSVAEFANLADALSRLREGPVL